MSNKTVSMPNNTIPNQGIANQGIANQGIANQGIPNQGIDGMMVSIGRGQAEMTVIISYIICVICLFSGIGLIIYGCIQFIRNFNCSAQQNEFDDKKPKCIEKKSLIFKIGIGLCIILGGILFVFLAKWNRTVVKNNPTMAAFQGMSSMFSRR